MGGGLIRSLGGWSALSKNYLIGAHIESDERILGDSDFVDSLFSCTDEKFEHYCNVKRSGSDLDKTAKKAALLCAVEPEDIFSRSRQKTKVEARSFFVIGYPASWGFPLPNWHGS